MGRTETQGPIMASASSRSISLPERTTPSVMSLEPAWCARAMATARREAMAGVTAWRFEKAVSSPVQWRALMVEVERGAPLSGAREGQLRGWAPERYVLQNSAVEGDSREVVFHQETTLAKGGRGTTSRPWQRARRSVESSSSVQPSLVEESERQF